MDEQTRPSAYEFGDFRVDVSQRLLLLKASGRRLPLNSRAFELLLLFLGHPDELLDKSTLMAAVWPTVVVDENNLNQHISALRRALGERPEEHRFIVTVPGRGYRFVAAVRRVTDSPGAPPSTSEEAAVPIPTGKSSLGRLWWGVAAAGCALAIAVGGYATHAWKLAGAGAEYTFSSTSALNAAPIDTGPVRKPRLAVLPFENLSPDPQNAFFADGLHEEIVSTIASQLPGVEVISRTTMMSYRTTPPKPLSVVARELGASHLIEGSVRRDANKVRLTLQLIDARTDGHIWSASYDRTLADVLNLESQVAQEVAAQLPAQLARAEHPPAAFMRDTEAFDLYLKALLAFRTFMDEPQAFRQILDLLTRAIARQPDFAPAYAQRARARTLMFIAGRDTSQAFVDQIRSDLATAQRLAPHDPTVLAVIGFFLMCTNDTSGALRAYAAAETAGLADPEYLIPKAHLLLRRSRMEEFNATVRRTLVLDPADPLIVDFAVYHFYRARQAEDALRVAEYGRTVWPGFEDWRAALLFEFAGRTRELRTALEREAPASDRAHLADSLPDYFQLLLHEHRYAELRAQIDRVPVASSLYYRGVDYGPVGPTPTALFRGWTDLLLADRAAAHEDGRAVLEFVQHQARTPRNVGYLDLLNAAGYTFTGDCESARAASDRALARVARADNAVIWTSTALHAARVKAWCGAGDSAVALLQQLSSGRPGVGPAVVTRDPLFSVPLDGVPSFRTLRDQLEATIRASRLQ